MFYILNLNDLIKISLKAIISSNKKIINIKDNKR